MEKICIKCSRIDPSCGFHPRKDGKARNTCKECSRSYLKKHYRDNREYYLKKARKSNDIARKKLKEFVDLLKATTPCLDCGKRYHPCAMDFHHLEKDNKEYDISQLVSAGLNNRLKKELTKCVILCAICHRIRHCANSAT
jgi:hypothetical protein